MTTYTESPTGLMLPPSRNGHAPIAESLAGYAATIELLESRLGQLEIQLEEQGWGRLGDSPGREFSRSALDNITELARVMYLKNPVVNRAVEIDVLYVWGQDLAVNAADDDVEIVIDRFWRDNRATLTGQQASRLLEVELQVTGNVFMALFSDAITGQVRVRTVPMEEVRRIVCNPEDRSDVWYYERRWTEQSVGNGASVEHTVYYPDWRYRPESKPASVTVDGREVEIRWDSPLLHVKSGAFLHWRWGVSEVYAGLDWARAYKEQLEDDATRSRALARFAWRITTDGGRAAVDQAKTRLGTTLGTTNRLDTNPPPVAGSAFIGDKSIGLDPIRIAGSTLDPDHSRPARLMASAGMGISDYVFDADGVKFATAQSLDRPTELRFSERRQMWRDVLTELCQFVIDADLAATRGMLPKSLADDQREVELSWPSLLERKTVDQVTAINTAAPYLSGELAARLMMTALGVEDIDGELAKMVDQGDTGSGTATATESKRNPKPATDLADAIAFFDRIAPDFAGLLNAPAAD